MKVLYSELQKKECHAPFRVYGTFCYIQAEIKADMTEYSR